MLRIGPFLLGLSLTALLALNGSGGERRLGTVRHLTLWAWERPERLTFLAFGDTSVAFLAGTVDLNSEPTLKPRLQPLVVSDATLLTAVVRLETTPSTPAFFNEEYERIVASQILRAADDPRISALQIDFDATESQRDFYRALLTKVRALMPPKMPLSMTALGSWCMGDDWISGLPIDDAVPMLFRMGRDRRRIMEALQGGREFSEPLCRGSLGLSTDEPWPVSLLGKRIYVFNPHAWSETSVAVVQHRLEP